MMPKTPRRATGTGRRQPPKSRALLGALGLAFAASLGLGTSDARADFPRFVERLWSDAQARGVPRPVFQKAFAGVTPDPKIMELTRRQAEFRESPARYLSKRVSSFRIENGQKRAAEFQRQLAEIERQYGVDRYVVLSVWGNETNYGGFMGGHKVITALATLTYNGYREDFFRKELLNALVILAQGHTTPDNMIGSWAGAMGHTQFMPSSFKAYAVDFTGDGRRDIWTTIPDALASTANYLKKHGWRPGETWGYEVEVPAGFNVAAGEKRRAMTLAEWQRLGVKRVHGKGFPRAGDTATMFAPSGASGPIFLTLPNFRVIKRYNNSNLYALAVGHLADRIRGGEDFAGAWPIGDLLSPPETEELQKLLTRRGYSVGTIDGRVGPQTRGAIEAFQTAENIRVPGDPSMAVLERLRSIN